MKYSLRKSFNYRRRKELPHEDDDPRIGTTNSNSNLVKPVKSRSFFQRRRHSSSSSDRIKSEVFEPRVDIYSDEEGVPSFTPVRPLDRLTNQIRQSFRNTLTRRRSRLESTTSTRHLISKQSKDIPVLPLAIATGLTSPLTLPVREEQKQQPPRPKTVDRLFRKRFSFLMKKPSENIKQEEPHPRSTFTRRFDTLRRSFRFGNRSSSTKHPPHLLSTE